MLIFLHVLLLTSLCTSYSLMSSETNGIDMVKKCINQSFFSKYGQLTTHIRHRRLMCDEKLPMGGEKLPSVPSSLNTHIALWPDIIRGISKAPLLSHIVNNTEIFFMEIVNLEQKLHKFVISESTYKFFLRKDTIGQGIIEFSEYDKSFSASNCNLIKIGIYFDNPLPFAYLQWVNLDHNHLDSYYDVYETILGQCPQLRTFSAAHNNLQGAFGVKHPTLERINVSHNKFETIGIVDLPNCIHVDLSYNQIACINTDAPHAAEYINKYLNLSENPITKPILQPLASPIELSDDDELKEIYENLSVTSSPSDDDWNSNMDALQDSSWMDLCTF